MHGHVSEARRWLRRALDAGSTEPSEARAKALDGAGYLAAEQYDEEAIVLLEESLACATQIGATSAAAIAAAHLCGVRPDARDAADRELAVEAGQTAITLAREAADDYALAIALNNLGVATTMVLRDREQAKTYYEESLEVRRRIGDVSRIALSLSNLGWVALDDGDVGRAASLFAEAAEIAGGIGDKRHVMRALAGLGWVAYSEQRYEEAESSARESLRLTRELGMKGSMIISMFCLAGTAADAGDGARAARIAAAASRHDSLLGAADPTDEARFRAVIDSAQSACDPQTWKRASAEGRAMSLDEAAAYALSTA